MRYSRYKKVRIDGISFFSDTRMKRVAVVGNSQSLFDRSYGVDIDKHDVVIRFNKPAPFMMEDVELTHGSKTNIWMFWAVGAFHRDVMENKSAPPLVKSQFLENKNIRKGQVRVNSHTALSRKYIDYTMSNSIYSSLKLELKQRSEYKPAPSVGISTLAWLHKCDPASVSIYGMDFKETPTFSEKDRFQKDMNGFYDSRCNHDFLAERQFIDKYILTDNRFRLFK